MRGQQFTKGKWLAAALVIAAIPIEGIASDNQYEATGQDVTTPVAGRGSIGMGVQSIYSHGDYNGPAGTHSGNVRFDSADLDASYYVSDHWELRLGLPYIASKYNGAFAHPLLPCPPNCQPTKIDDGTYHGFWQDWNAGATYHMDVNSYSVAPSFDVYIPSNNYPFYGAAAVGQRTRRIGLSLDIGHQFELSNIYYDLHAQYIFNQHVLGIDNNYYTVGGSVGYFFNPRISLRGLADLKLGDGYDDAQIGPFAPGPGAPTNGDNPIWEFHDKFRLEEHFDLGAALDYSLNRDYQISLSGAHSIWGRANARLTYDFGLRLTRHF